MTSVDRPGHDPRRASLADLPAVERVIAQAYAIYLDRMEVSPAPMLADHRSAILLGDVWVLGEPIIAVIALVAEPDGVLVENVAVAPAAQGAGIGRRLMAFAEQHARSCGLNRLRLYTNEVMTENLAIYARLGYQETARRVENGYRRVYLEKLLTPDN
jgi:GNAT superfamily N-acetyltransferase